MKKKLFCAVILITTLVLTLTCSCSCKQPFNYDWSAIDNLMNEIGEEDNLYYYNGTVETYGKKLTLLYDKNEDREISFKLTKYYGEPFGMDKRGYRLYFDIRYYNLVPDVIVSSNFKWEFASSDTHDYCFVLADISYFINGEESGKNFRRYKTYAINNLQLNDEQFESCEYLNVPIKTLSDSEYLVGHLELEQSDEYYLNYLLSEGFKATTEFFKNNNLPSLYRYTERIPHTIVSNIDSAV